MKKLLLTLGFVASTIFSYSQKWTEMMQDPNANFYDIVAEFDNYWKDKPYERGHGYKAFKRWQWYNEPRVYPSGNLKFGARGFAFEQYQEFLNNNPQAKLSSAAAISATTANWIPLGPFGSPVGGDAGRVQVVEVHPTNPNMIYCGTAAGGFWMSNNGGVSYTTTTDNFASCGVSDIAIDPTNPSNIYISTGDKDAGDTYATGVMKSTDGGNTWAPTGLAWGVSQQRRIYRLLINPTNPNILIVASNNGIHRTTDGGTTWTQVIAGTYVDAEFKPGDPTIVYAVSNGQSFKSINSGASFSAVNIASNLNSNRLSMCVTAANPNVVYILVSNTSNGFGGLYRSTNEGASYSLMSSTPNIFDWSTNGSGAGGQGWYDIAIDASPTNSNEIIAGGVNTWKSTNGGTSWVLNTHWFGGGGKPYVHADLHSVHYTSGTTCYLGTDGGVARTTNSGAAWTTINGNMNIAQIYKLGNSANNPLRIVTGHQDNGTNLSNGTNWNEIYGGDGAANFIDWGNNNTIVASYVEGDFQRSTNGGGGWVSISNGITGTAAWVAPIIQHPTQQQTFYAGYQSVWRSTNQGTSWTQLGNIGAVLDEIRIAPSNTNIIFATAPNGVYKTTNGGTSWSNVTGSIPVGSAQITDLAVDNLNANNVYVTLSGYSNGNKVYFSSNGGTTWTNYSTGLPNLPVNCIAYTKNSAQAIYVGTDIGVYYREASMSSWLLYNSGMPNINVSDLQIYYPTNKLRAATYARGVWETDLYSNPLAPPNAAFGLAFSNGCQSIPLQFTDQSANTPTSWNWSFPGGSPATSSSQNPLVTYASTGIYSVTLTSINANGSSNPYTTTISVVSAPTIAVNNPSICGGQSAILTASTNAQSVIWQNGQQGLMHNVVANNNMSYSYTASLGACNVSGTSSITVSPAPQIPVIGFDNNGALTTTVVAQSYQWYLNGSPINGETNNTINPTTNGWYSIWVANGSCVASSNAIEYLLVGITEKTNIFNGLNISPVPATDEITVNYPYASPKQKLSFEIVNALGQVVLASDLKIDSVDNSAKINIQSLSSGAYIINFKTENKKGSYKLIKS